MCLFVSNEYPHRYIATEPMTVFKIIGTDDSSLYRGLSMTRMPPTGCRPTSSISYPPRSTEMS